MLNRLKLLVSSIVVVACATQLSAKKIPITEEAEITISVGKFSVIEFPFKVEGKKITSFLTKKAKGQVKKPKSKLDDALSKPIVKPKGPNNKPAPKPKSKYINISQTTNGFTFFPKKEGVMKMVVWGYDHPILLTVRASRKDGFGLYQFTKPHTDSKDLKLTEQGTHESVINKLMVHLFNQTLPKGYKSVSKDVDYSSNGFSFRLNRELLGKKYVAQEWLLTNESNDKSIVHEESFYQKGVFGISLEADSIDKDESIRVFIVRSAYEEGR